MPTPRLKKQPPPGFGDLHQREESDRRAADQDLVDQAHDNLAVLDTAREAWDVGWAFIDTPRPSTPHPVLMKKTARAAARWIEQRLLQERVPPGRLTPEVALDYARRQYGHPIDPADLTIPRVPHTYEHTLHQNEARRRASQQQRRAGITGPAPRDKPARSRPGRDLFGDPRPPLTPGQHSSMPTPDALATLARQIYQRRGLREPPKE